MQITIQKYDGAAFSNIVRLLEKLEPWKSDRMDDEYYRSVLDDRDPNRILIAESKNNMCGVVVWQRFQRYPYGGYIRILAVSEKEQGCGIGNMLLKRAEEDIFKDLKNSFVSVHETNAVALEFYKRRNYYVVGPLHDYIHKDQTMLMLRKSIGPVW